MLWAIRRCFGGFMLRAKKRKTGMAGAIRFQNALFAKQSFLR